MSNQFSTTSFDRLTDLSPLASDRSLQSGPPSSLCKVRQQFAQTSLLDRDAGLQLGQFKAFGLNRWLLHYTWVTKVAGGCGHALWLVTVLRERSISEISAGHCTRVKSLYISEISVRQWNLCASRICLFDAVHQGNLCLIVYVREISERQGNI